MTLRFTKRAAAACFACTLPFFTTACSKNAKQETKIKQLEQELQDQKHDNEKLRTYQQKLELEKAELKTKSSQAEQAANIAKGQATTAQREAESLRAAKTAEVARTRSETPAKKLDARKSGFEQQLAAILLLDGDVSKGRGFLVKAEGKTWLYSSAQSFSGNTRLTIKDTSGNIVTKLGEFQVAADSPVARLEIQQEMPVTFELAPDGPVEASSSLMTASPSAETGALQAIECHPTDIVGANFGLDASGEQSSGLPVVATDSGKVVAMLAPAPLAIPLWPDPQAGSYVDPVPPRAHRVNRAIDWKKSSISAFLAERKKIDELNSTTRILHAVAQIRFAGNELQLDGSITDSNLSVRQILDQNAALPMVVELKKLHSDLSAKKVRASERDISRRVDRSFQEAASIGRRQTQDLKIANFSFLHKPSAEAALKWRAEADKALAATIESLPK